MTRIVDYEELFWQKVDASGDCWEWTAYIGQDGYGKTAVNLGGGKTKSRCLACHAARERARHASKRRAA